MERIKVAIKKASVERQTRQPDRLQSPQAQVAPIPLSESADNSRWEALEPVRLDECQMVAERIIAHHKVEPEHAVFDVLRTRVLKLLEKNGWRRIGVTSPHRGAGKTTISANLAFSLARLSNCKTMLLDIDLSNPSIGEKLGAKQAREIEAFLSGRLAPEEYFLRFNSNLALGLNSMPVKASAEVIQAKKTQDVLEKSIEHFAPSLVIYDLPPILAGDDAIAFLANVDCVFLVVGAGESSASDIEECEGLLVENSEFLGILLNKTTGKVQNSQPYGFIEHADDRSD